MMEAFLQDLQYSIRILVKKPGFTAIVILALALGIGANTAIFSVVNAVMLRPLPYSDPEGLVMVWETNPQKGRMFHPVSSANYLDWRDQNHVFDYIAAMSSSDFVLSGGDVPEQIQGALVSASFFPLLGVEPFLGRAFLPEEDQPGGEPVVILSYGLWQHQFGADTSLIGKRLILNGVSRTVIGVMPAGFDFTGEVFTLDADLWVPIAFAQSQIQRGPRYLGVVARLAPGVTVEKARSEMEIIAQELAGQYPQTNSGRGVNVISVHEQAIRETRSSIIVLLVTVGFVLLIACANIANLLLARATARRKEAAIRAALGASRYRIVRQLLTESVLLSLLGGALGLLLAFIGIEFLANLIPGDIPRVKHIGLEGRVLGFTMLISVLTGILFGMAPALESSKIDLHQVLKEGGRTSTTGSGSHRLRGLLVISEIALALVLLSGAGLMINSFMRLQKIDPGFDAQNVLTMQISLPRSRYPEAEKQKAFFQQILQRAEALPAVTSASMTYPLPLSREYAIRTFTIEGLPIPDPKDRPDADYNMVSPGHFRTAGIRMLSGRDFSEDDVSGTQLVAIINETLARRFWGNENPIGKYVIISDGVEAPRQIIGVVGDVKQIQLDAEPRPQLYLTYLQQPNDSMFLAVRSTSNPTMLASAIRNEVLALDRDQPIYNVKTMQERLSYSISQKRFSMIFLCLFAAIALTLAAVGIYGVVSYSVMQRTHEIGIRMAVGAGQRDILSMIVRQAMVLVLIGVGIGLASAFALTRLMSSLLYGVSPTDPPTFIAISLLLIAVALAACFIPARRATVVDPIVVLRYE
jgi:putative ABC transport system permease protein